MNNTILVFSDFQDILRSMQLYHPELQNFSLYADMLGVPDSTLKCWLKGTRAVKNKNMIEVLSQLPIILRVLDAQKMRQ